jgi:hypothetical protein
VLRPFTTLAAPENANQISSVNKQVINMLFSILKTGCLLIQLESFALETIQLQMVQTIAEQEN